MRAAALSAHTFGQDPAAWLGPIEGMPIEFLTAVRYAAHRVVVNAMKG